MSSTTVQVALPLPQPEAEGEAASAASSSEQLVYAFLPVRSYGLPFSVHADWVLPASRQDITASSSWNQLLRAQVGGWAEQLLVWGAIACSATADCCCLASWL